MIRAELDKIAFTKTSERSRRALDKIQAFIDKQKAAGKSVDFLPKETIKRLGQISANEVTNEDLAAIADKVEALSEEGLARAEAAEAQKKLKVDLITKTLSGELTKTNDAKTTFKTFLSEDIETDPYLTRIWKTIKGGKNQGVIHAMTPLSLLSSMDGGTPGTFVKYIWRPLKEMRRVELSIMDDYHENYIAKMNMLTKGTDYFEVKNIAGLKLSGSSKLAILRLAQDPVQLQHIIENNKIDMEQIQAIHDSLSENEKQILELNKEFYKKLQPKIEAVYRKVENRAFPGVDNYHPSEFRSGQSVGNDPVNVVLEQAGLSREGLDKGFTVARVKSHELLLKFDLDGAADRHIKKVARYLAYAEKHHEVTTTLHNLKTSVTNQYGPKMHSILDKWVNDVVYGQTKSTALISEILRKARGVTYSSTLAFNPSVWINQLASYTNGANEIGYDWLAKGTAHVVKDIKGSVETMNNESVYMKTRMNDPALEEFLISMETQRNKISGNLKKIMSKGMYPITAVDKFVAAQVYWGAKLKYLESNPGDTKGAVLAGEEAVEISQNMSDTLYRPEALRSDELTSQLFMYSTQQLQSFSKIVQDKIAAKNGNISKKKFTSTILNVAVLPAIILSIAARLKFDDKTPGEAAKQAIGVIPYLSQAMSYIEYNNGQIELGGLGPLKFLGKFGVDAVNAWNYFRKGDDEKFKDKIKAVAWDALDASLSSQGASRRPLVVPIKGFNDMMNGTDTRWQRLFKSQGQIGPPNLDEVTDYETQIKIMKKMAREEKQKYRLKYGLGK